jgi:hypothetical protein
MLTFAQPLYKLPTFAIMFFAGTSKSLWSIFHGSGSSCNGCATLGKLQLAQRDTGMPRDKYELKAEP